MVSAGEYHTALLRNDGKICIAGSAEVLGDYNLTAAQIQGPFRQVSAGGAHTLFLNYDGNVTSLGCNDCGQCLLPNPRTMTDGPYGRYVQVSAGDKHSVALRSDGQVVYAGLNHGRHHSKQTGAKTQPEAEPDINLQEANCVQVSAGHAHTALLYEDGTVGAFGNNMRGQCNVPESLAPFGPYVQVSAGGAHTVLLRSSGNALAVGSNQHGQCDIPSGTRYSRVWAGARHTVLLREDGHVEAVGCNTDGQCEIPPLEEGLTYIQASAGGHHTALLRSDGQAFAVGDEGDVSIPSVQGKQSWSDWFLQKPMLPDGVEYVADTGEFSVARVKDYSDSISHALKEVGTPSK